MGFRPSKAVNAAMQTHMCLETGSDYIVQATGLNWHNLQMAGQNLQQKLLFHIFKFPVRLGIM